MISNKFRIWSFAQKTLYYFKIENYPKDIVGAVSSPQQCIELKDKYNKDIYEGDILLIKNDYPMDNDIVRVVYDGCAFCYKDIYTDKITPIVELIGLDVTKDDFAEIIGNDFEDLKDILVTCPMCDIETSKKEFHKHVIECWKIQQNNYLHKLKDMKIDIDSLNGLFTNK